MSIGFRPHSPLPSERGEVLWRLHKDGRTAEARVRFYPHGQELRVLASADLAWLRLQRWGEDFRTLGLDSEGRRGLFEAKGWLRVRTWCSSQFSIATLQTSLDPG